MNKMNFLFLFLFLFCLSPISADFIINDQKIIITPYDDFGTYKIQENLNVSVFDTYEVILPIVPVYDLIVKINNNRYSNISYTPSFLTINLDSVTNLDIEIIYLTDHYISKQENIWNLEYLNKFDKTIDELQITLPKKSIIKNSSNHIENTKIINNSFVITSKEIDSFFINYEIDKTARIDKNSPIFFIMIFFFSLIIGFAIFKFKKRNIKKDHKENNLLLGLNENEQKIVKLLLNQKEGLTQKQIALKLFLPKGTISRNIQKLVDKGYLDIKKYGVSNKVFLGEVFKK